jgi:hypothetical protein
MQIDLDSRAVDRAHYRASRCGWRVMVIGMDGLVMTKSREGRIDCLSIAWNGKATLKKGIVNENVQTQQPA